MKKPNKNIIGQGAIVRSLRKPRNKKPEMVADSANEPDTDEYEFAAKAMKKGC